MIATIFLFIFGLLFLVAAFPLGIWTYIELRWSKPISFWKEAKGVITESRLVSNKNCNGFPGYHYKIRYRYILDGNEYEDTQIRTGSFRYFTKNGAIKLINRYPVGSEISVYYNPDFKRQYVEESKDYEDPISVLEPGFNVECLYPISIFLANAALFLSCVFWAISRISG